MGTSLTVHPFAALADLVPRNCVRVLMNHERVGDFGRSRHDVICLGNCDDLVKELCTELGWIDELNSLWALTHGEDVEGEVLPPDADKLKDEVEKLTEDIGKKLALDDVSKRIAAKQAVTVSPSPEGRDASKADDAEKEDSEHQKPPHIADGEERGGGQGNDEPVHEDQAQRPVK
jgi:NAD-dependent histone deacetylase SIR2